MNGIQTNTSDMKDTQRIIEKCTEDFRQASSELIEAIKSLGKSGWTGEASRTYVENATKLKKDLDDTIAKLEKDAKVLGMQADNYDEAGISIAKASNNI